MTSRIFVLIVFMLSSVISHAQESGKHLFTDNWSFHKGDLNVEDLLQNKSQGSWQPVSLPHDWSIQEPFSSEWASGTGFLPGGIGWYKKSFTVEDFDKNKQYAIYFDGVYKNSEVWINGHYLGKRPNGFIPFQYDLTPYLRSEDNEILVKADHTDFADSRYYTGSGIYRNVYLITQPKVHFSQWGIFFATPIVTKKSAEFNIDIAFQNLENSDKKVQINAVLRDKSGNIVAKTDSLSTAFAGQENHATLKFDIENPLLWSPENPHLYNLTVQLSSEGNLLEEWNGKTGIRKFRFDPDKGFFLNGENLLIKGVCIHHDAGALGAAVPEGVWRERLQTLKDLGANAIRMSHYPHQDYLYDLCDEMGFLVQDEAFDEWEVGKNKWIEGWNVGTPGNDGYHVAFAEWGARDVKDMILRNRNHPSIFMWSVGNEIDYPNDPYSHPVLDEGKNPQIYGRGYEAKNAPASRLGEIAAELVDAAKNVDTTRPITAALAGVTMSNQTNYPQILDIVGYNYQEYRYGEDHEKYFDRVIYGSENGDALSAWKAVTENKFIASQFLWTAFDFIGEARKWPSRSSGAGIIDLAGKPKPDFYFRKSLWTTAPMVYLGIADSEKNVLRRSNIGDVWKGEAGETKWVTCYTNTESVELFLNGKSLGVKNGTYDEDKMIAWEVPYEAGELVVKAYKNEKEVANYVLNTPGKLASMQVKIDTKDLENDVNGLIIVDILLIDDKNIAVTDDDREITFEVSGNTQLLGLESGDLSSHEDYQANSRKTYKGKLRAYLKTSGDTGKSILNLSSPGLSTKNINLTNAK